MNLAEFKALTGRTALYTAPIGRKKYGTLKVLHFATLRDCACPVFKTAYPWAWVGAEIEESTHEVKPADLADYIAWVAEEY
jgi:hypothetical protein